MRRYIFSFKIRLLLAFLLASLIPLVLSSLLLIKTAQIRLNIQAQNNIQEQLNVLSQTLDSICRNFENAKNTLQKSELVSSALLETTPTEITEINTLLFSTTDMVRKYASVHLYNLQGEQKYSTSNKPNRPNLSLQWGILHKIRRAPHETTYQITFSNDTSINSALQIASLLKNPQNQEIGFLVFELTKEHFETIFRTNLNLNENFFLVNEYFRPLYSTNQTSANFIPSLRQQLFTGEYISSTSDNFLYEITYHPPTGLFLILQKPHTFNTSTVGLLYALSIICVLISIAVSLLLAIPLRRQILAPVALLQNAFYRLKQDDLSVKLPTQRNDEIGELYKDFNTTVTTLQQNREDLIKKQKDLNEAQINLLQTQLNPHFLCNTLDTIKWISKIHDIPQVADISTNLASILRFSLIPEQFVLLYKEIAILEWYVEIQKVRMSEDFTFQVNLPDFLSNTFVPKMIIQPLVENAIIHGLACVEDPSITVDIFSKNNELKIAVTDNGCGLPEDYIDKRYRDLNIVKGKHLGLYNVDTILEKYYGEQYGLFMTTGSQGKGTSIIATIPLHNKTEE